MNRVVGNPITYFGIILVSSGLLTSADAQSLKQASPIPSASVLVSQAALDSARKQVDQGTHTPTTEIEKLASDGFVKFGRALGIPSQQLQDARAADHGTFVLAMTDKWIYHVDCAGNQTFRPVSNLPILARAFDTPYTNEFDSRRTQVLSDKAMGIAQALGYLTNLASLSKESITNVVVKREVVVASECATGRLLSGNGRVMVRLCWEKRGDDCLQVIFAPDDTPIEVDTVGDACKAPGESAALKAALKNGRTTSSLQDGLAGAKVGLFYGGNAYNFPANALSWGGSDFVEAHSKGNPFRRTIFEDRIAGDFRNIDFETNLHSTPDFKFWDYFWWDMYGRVNGPGGNWDETSHKWDKDVSVDLAPLQSYKFVAVGFTGSVQVKLKDGEWNLPKIRSATLEDRFYNDLESCRIVEIATHGGPIDHRFQLRRDIDEWFLVGNVQHPFGTGNLRHMFFSSCGSMGIFKQMTETPNEQDNRELLTEWLPAKYVNGLRTVCGVDGEGTGLDRDGWRFFGHYNKGDSISSAFTNAVIDECVRNEPVTVAYGATPAEAVSTLADGRFSSVKSSSVWSAASVWRAVSGEF